MAEGIQDARAFASGCGGHGGLKHRIQQRGFPGRDQPHQSNMQRLEQSRLSLASRLSQLIGPGLRGFTGQNENGLGKRPCALGWHIPSPEGSQP
jgi:hypothetical protein